MMMGRMYRNKAEYIENLATVMSAREEFKDLEYKKHPSTQEEFLFMSAVTGEVFMFDITGYANEQILHIMAMIECGQKPSNQITDREKRLELGKLFN
jgi:hypothetical protein